MKLCRVVVWLVLGLLAPGPAWAEMPAVCVATDAIQPQLAIDAAGRIYVVSIHRGNIAVSASTDGGKTFGDPVVAIDVKGRARGGLQRGPRIGVDARGRLTVTAPVTFDDAEYQRKYPTAELYATTSSDGGKTWSAPMRVNEVLKKAPEALHWMAVAADGVAHVAWLDIRDRQAGQDIYYARIVDGKPTANQRVAQEVCECCAPGLAVDARGHVLIAYREGGRKRSREIFVRHSSDGGATFSDPVQINRSPTLEDVCPMSAPIVAIAPQGQRFAAAWMDLRTGERDPNVYWTIADRPVFTTDHLLHDRTKGEQNHPSLTIDSQGTVWAAWEDSRSGGQRIWLRSSSPADPERPISRAEEGPASFPVLASQGTFIGLVYETKKGAERAVVFRAVGKTP